MISLFKMFQSFSNKIFHEKNIIVRNTTLASNIKMILTDIKFYLMYFLCNYYIDEINCLIRILQWINISIIMNDIYEIYIY